MSLKKVIHCRTKFIYAEFFNVIPRTLSENLIVSLAKGEGERNNWERELNVPSAVSRRVLVHSQEVAVQQYRSTCYLARFCVSATGRVGGRQWLVHSQVSLARYSQRNKIVSLVGREDRACVKARDHRSSPGHFSLEPVCGAPRNKRNTKESSEGKGGLRSRNTSSTRRPSIPRSFAMNELAIN